MNDAGDLHFYRYDLKEKTIQRYFQDPLEAEQKKNAESYPTLLNQYDTLVGKYNVQTILSIVFALVALLLAALSIFLWQTRSKLKKIIAEVLNIDESTIELNSAFVDDLGADSLDLFEIITGIEEEFELEIPQEVAENIHTVNDAVEEIKKATGN